MRAARNLASSRQSETLSAMDRATTSQPTPSPRTLKPCPTADKVPAVVVSRFRQKTTLPQMPENEERRDLSDQAGAAVLLLRQSSKT